MKLGSPQDVGLSARRLGAIAKHLDRYVEDGRLPGYQVMVARHGDPVYLHSHGQRDVEAGKPVTDDTVFRIYSMTKPVTTVAALMLYEQGRFQLNDPIERYIPQFEDMQVFAGGDAKKYDTVPAERPITIRDLMTHTSGLTYGLFEGHPLDTLYREHKVMGGSLDDLIDRASSLPLAFSPGTRWNYSVATDVLGYLVQVLSGQSLDEFFAEHIFKPLGMTDTGFWVHPDQQNRLAACYSYRQPADGKPSYVLTDSPQASPFLERPAMLSGGGGLVSTTADYFRFSQMLLNGGQLESVRLLGRKTVESMTSNHLPGGVDLSAMGMPVFSETPFDGIGFGLGVSVLIDPPASQILGSTGEYAWGGLASTAFWNDPVEHLTVIFMTQLIPSSTYQIRRELRVLAYQALIA